MAETQTYTYRNGQKILLNKSDDEFIVRATPEELQAMGIPNAEQVSSASSRVMTRSADLEPAMSRSRFIAPTHHAYFEADSGAEFLITDRIFVSFKTGTSQRQIDEFAGKYGLVKLAQYNERDALFQLTDHTGMNPVKLVVKLTEEESIVALAEHDLNYRMTTYQVAIPTDPDYVRQWHLHTRLVNADFDLRATSHSDEAWQLLDSYGNANVVIGITDDGCKLDHGDFNGPDKFAGWGYFRGNRLITTRDIDAVASEMYKSGSNHGTSCAGVIGGEVDAALTVGAAPGCRLLPIQWESSGPSLFISDSKLLTALNFVADKVDVLSNSWGSSPTSNWAQPVINRIAQLGQMGGRRGKGIVFLWAAGNENCPIKHTASVNVPFTHGWRQKPDGSWFWAGPATARSFEHNLVGISGLLHVAALASTSMRSHYSNYGTGIDICAPTSNSHAYFRMTVRGLGITTTTGDPENVTNEFGGTSSATPLVAGIVGLVISANSELSAVEVCAILKQTAAKDLNMTTYARTPAANFDPNPTWDISPIAPFDHGDFTDIGAADGGAVNGTWSPWFGHGRVDAQAAVAEAIRRKQPVDGTEHLLQKTSAPAKTIPDRDSTGIRDTIACPTEGVISALSVTVDITHSYIGDLRVSLIAPSGSEVVLHDRSGSNSDNLKQTWDSTNTVGLLALKGQSALGDWTLLVQDLAALDVGMLAQWQLTLDGQAVTRVVVEEAPGIRIPNYRRAGIIRTLTVSETGKIADFDLDVDITHTAIGDLTVTLTAPNAAAFILHQRTGGTTDNLITTYSSTNIEALKLLRGEAMTGDWMLKVVDLKRSDVGKLNRWALKIVSG